MTQLHIDDRTGERSYIDVSRPLHVPYSPVVRALLMIPVAVYMAAVVMAFVSGTSVGAILLVTSAILVIVGYIIGSEIRTANRIDNAVSRIAFRVDGHRNRSEAEYSALYRRISSLSEILIEHATDTALRMADAHTKAEEREKTLYDTLRAAQADLWERLGAELLAINGGQAAQTRLWQEYVQSVELVTSTLEEFGGEEKVSTSRPLDETEAEADGIETPSAS